MEFGLSREQEMLRATMAELLDRHAGVERVREVMATVDAVDRELLAGLADQGLTGLMVDEEHGGAGLGLFETSLLAQELGRRAAPLDLAPIVRATLLLAASSGETAASLLGRVAEGAEIPAVLEGLRREDGRLHGSVELAPGILQATLLLVEAGGRWLVVPRTGKGVRVTPQTTIDETRRWATVEFGGVAVDDCEELATGPPREARERARQTASVVTAADSLGACYRAIELAVDYARTREQFGRVIGSFQAVKHLCAEMIAEVDPVQSLLWYAAYAWDREQDDAAWVCDLLQAHAAEVGTDCVSKATQVFGGIGFTWECDLHLFFKRVQVNRQVVGRPEELRRRAAELQGLKGADGAGRALP